MLRQVYLYIDADLNMYILITVKAPVPVAERSKARVYGRSLAGIAGSNTAGGMDGCPL